MATAARWARIGLAAAVLALGGLGAAGALAPDEAAALTRKGTVDPDDRR